MESYLMSRVEMPITGIRAEIKMETLIISSDKSLKTLSSAVLGGGFNRTRYILNHHVEKDFSHTSPSLYLKKISQSLGIKERVVGMMTAADIENLSVAAAKVSRLKIASVITGGISNAAAAGERNVGRKGPGTINTILLTDGNLTEAAMAGTIITVTEAKTAALLELGVKSVTNNGIATGTTTDAVVVACTQKGPKIRFSGTATLLGELVGKTVKKAAKEAIKKQEGWS
jgi:iron complex transport system ATP-binding protein